MTEIDDIRKGWYDIRDTKTPHWSWPGMNPFAKDLLSLFAKPLGAALNNALAAGSAAVILWSAKQGMDGNIVTPIVAAVVNVISVTIASLAATQGVQIPIINADKTNGVTVVSANAAAAAGIPKADAPKA